MGPIIPDYPFSMFMSIVYQMINLVQDQIYRQMILNLTEISQMTKYLLQA